MFPCSIALMSTDKERAEAKMRSTTNEVSADRRTGSGHRRGYERVPLMRERAGIPPGQTMAL